MVATDRFSPHVFRAYDIRGRYPDDVHEAGTHALGLAFGTEAQKGDQKTVVVGRDVRLSSPSLEEALVAGLRASGCDVITLGMVPTPIVYFACHHLKQGAGMMVTASHNPGYDNGFKMLLGHQSLTESNIEALKERVNSQRFSQGEGSLSHADVIPAYLQALTQDIQLPRRMKVVVDAGHGAMGPLAVQALTALGCDLIPMYCTPDGHFPAHHPDPAVAANLHPLMQRVLAERADVGFAFDGDGDRLGMVSAGGEIIWPDRMLMLLAREVLVNNPGAGVVFDVKSSMDLVALIQKHQGLPLISRTGHSFLKRKMKDCDALLGGEMSGHLFFRDRWFGFDDALYAACRLLVLLAQNPNQAAWMAQLPQRYNTPEIIVPVPEELKARFVAAFGEKVQFPQAHVLRIDGLRVEYPDRWGLLRMSNTSPALVMRFEGNTPEALQAIQQEFMTPMAQIAQDLGCANSIPLLVGTDV